MFITNTKDKRLSDTVNFMHRSITHPVITHGDQAINALARLVKRVDKMTGKNTALTKKNGVNMKDLQSLASVAARITAANPEIAEQRAPPEISQPVRSANRNPNMHLNSVIEHLQRSPRLNKTQMEILDRVSKRERVRQSSLNRLPQTAVEARARIDEMKQNQALPRVQDTQSKAAPRVQKAPTRKEI